MPNDRIKTILILGGTKEAAALAAELVSQHPDWRVITSLAGRTREPKPVAGEVRIGGFGGAAGPGGLSAPRTHHKPDRRHPSFRPPNLRQRQTRRRADRRPPRNPHPPAMAKAAGRQLAGSQLARGGPRRNPNRRARAAGPRLAAHRPLRQPADVHFIVRMVDKPDSRSPLPDHELMLGLPVDEGGETRLLKRCGITHIVCRNSGGRGAYGKIAAARAQKLPVIMVARTKD